MSIISLIERTLRSCYNVCVGTYRLEGASQVTAWGPFSLPSYDSTLMRK